MKRLLPTCFLPLAVTFTLHAGISDFSQKPDTVTVHSTGINNRVVIDSIHIAETFNEHIGSAVKGEITQSGENNKVEINTKVQAPNNKCEKTINKSQTNSKIQTTKTKQSANAKPATCNLKPATFTIKQTGKNNSVKINSR